MIREAVSYGRKVASDWATSNYGARQWVVRTSDGGQLQDGKRRRGFRDCANVAIYAGQRRHARRAAGRAIGQRARSDVLAGVRTTLVVGAVLLGIDWNPLSWWDTVSGWVGQGWDDVKRFVHAAINTALGLIEGAFNLLDYVFTVVTNALQAGLDWASNIASGAFNWIIHAADTVGGWIWHTVISFWNDVIVPAIDGLTAALNWAEQMLSQGINDIWGWLSGFVHDFLTPIWGWIVHAAETVAGWIWGAIDSFYQEFIAPIVHDLEDAWHYVTEIWDWLWREGVDAVHLVEKAWQWLVWFGEHTFDDLRNLFDSSTRGVGIDGMVTAIVDEYDEAHALLDRLASWLS